MGYVWDAEGRGLGVLLDKEGEQRCIAAAVLSAGAISLHKEHGLLGSHLGGVACVCLVPPAKLSWALPLLICLCVPVLPRLQEPECNGRATHASGP